MLDEKLLAIYLNDHRAGAVVGRQLGRRARAANEGTEYGAFLGRLVSDIEADLEELDSLMERLAVGRDRAKTLAAVTVEKAGRLKLNGRLLGYSPLSRLLELEGLRLGVTGKRALWEALRELQQSDPRLAGADFDALIERAAAQLDELEDHRRRAAREALAPG
jgi:hypothetical protein